MKSHLPLAWTWVKKIPAISCSLQGEEQGNIPFYTLYGLETDFILLHKGEVQVAVAGIFLEIFQGEEVLKK